MSGAARPEVLVLSYTGAYLSGEVFKEDELVCFNAFNSPSSTSSPPPRLDAPPIGERFCPFVVDK
jgi:hypothetical protein